MNPIEQNPEWRAQQRAEAPEGPDEPETVRAYRAVRAEILDEPIPAPRPELIAQCRAIDRRYLRRARVGRRWRAAGLIVATVTVLVFGAPGLARFADAANAADAPWPMLLTAVALTISGALFARRWQSLNKMSWK